MNDACSRGAGGGARDGREHEVAGVEEPRRLALELLEVLGRGQRPAELRDLGLHRPEAADELAGGAGARAQAGRELARAARELAQARLQRAGAVGQRPTGRR